MKKIEHKRFGKYLLLDRIGIGGMAELYMAIITGVQGFEKVIAVKKILPHLTSEKELITAFIDEAKLAALLHHQNIVQIYDFGELENSYFIAMEHLSGKDLKKVIEKSKIENMPLSLEHAIYIISRVAAGLQYAHTLKDFQGNPLNIIHRDISPQNIFITYEGEVKIVDFGIAKAATQSTMTQVGIIKGKVGYMSPEQADGKAIDHRSDIFSLGIVLYELVTGNKMFKGDTMQVLAKVRQAEFIPPDQLVEDLPQKLLEIIYKALAREKEDRYQSCGDMLADLEECMYLLHMRPTGRSLSTYMKKLFQDEIIKEQEELRLLLGKGAEELTHEELPEEIKKEIPEPADSVKESKFSTKKIFIAIASFIVLLALTLPILFWPEKKPTNLPVEVASSDSGKEETSPVEQIKELAADSKEGIRPAPSKENETPESTKSDRVFSNEAHESTKNQLLLKQKEAKKALLEKKYAQAILLFDEILNQTPNLRQELSDDYEKALLGEVNSLGKDELNKKENLLLKMINLYPESRNGHFMLGLLYVQSKQYPKAVSEFKKVTQLDPNFTEAFFNLGYLYAVDKQYEKAEVIYQRVVDLRPEYIDEALFNLAMVQKLLGKKEKYLKNLQKAFEANPNNEKIKAYLKRAKLN